MIARLPARLNLGGATSGGSPLGASFAREQRGITLIEIVVVLILVGLLGTVALPSLRSVFGVDRRTASRQLAATMRFVYEEAAIRNTPMRMAYDLDSNAWWVEAADSDVRIFANRKEKEAFDEFLEAKQESDERVREEVKNRRSDQPDLGQLVDNFLGEEEGGGGGGMAGGFLGGLFGGGGGAAPLPGDNYSVNEFRPLGPEDDFFERHQLPSSVKFFGVWTPQHDETMRPMDEFEIEAMMREPADERRWRIAYTHIFPGGYMEDTVVFLSDAAGESITSLVVEPLMGRVQVFQDEAEIPDTRDRERDG